MTELLFAYGTLRPDLDLPRARRFTRRLEPLGLGWTPGRLFDLGRYPAARFKPLDAGRVMGVVCRLPPDEGATLGDLDAYEGFDPENLPGSLYMRMQGTVTLLAGGDCLCWMYQYSHAVADERLIADGDYAAWLRRSPSAHASE